MWVALWDLASTASGAFVLEAPADEIPIIEAV
jgi:hypothetical protein